MKDETINKGFFKSHTKEIILKKCTQLKESDGEGWIIGDFVEKYINGDIIILDKNMIREIKLNRVLKDDK